MWRRIAFGVMRRGRRPRFPCTGPGGAGAVVHPVLAGQARHDDAERMQLAGGKLEAGNGRELVAGYVIGLRRSGAAVKLSGKGWGTGLGARKSRKIRKPLLSPPATKSINGKGGSDRNGSVRAQEPR
jgi:hypothetical protein